MSLAGQIAVVTGASRGIGQGIALQLGAAGATVYVTGRAPGKSEAGGALPTLEETAKEITARGGRGIAAFVDHSDVDDVKAFFDRVAKETSGQLDILVNNAYSAVNYLLENAGKKFWELEPEAWDQINNVGLRNHYFCSVYAARLMVKAGGGLIVNISSAGGLRYLFNVAYGAGKEALDRMSVDMGIELKTENVTVVSLWPGYVRTQLVTSSLREKVKSGGQDAKFAEKFLSGAEQGESIEYAGKAVVALASDPKRFSKTGRVLQTTDLGAEYKFLDIDGRQPASIRSLSTVLGALGYTTLAAYVPAWVCLPSWVLHASANKF